MERDTILVMNVTGRQGDQLDILVENMGRVNFGTYINDNKARDVKDDMVYNIFLKLSNIVSLLHHLSLLYFSGSPG